jgi:hypothetical protein
MRRTAATHIRCGRETGGSGKLADPVLHREPSHTKILAMRRAILKIKAGLAYLSLDLTYMISRDTLKYFIVRMSFLSASYFAL